MFDIVPGSERGSFSIKARFLGVEMEEFLLKYQVQAGLNAESDNWSMCQRVFSVCLTCSVCMLQDLLQLQYEGVAVMKMFDKAKINVNLLIFLLNKKFFKK